MKDVVKKLSNAEELVSKLLTTLDEKKFFNEFREFHTDFIITNWRIIFEPTKAKPEFKQFIAKQPEYVRAFFDVRLA